MRHTSQQPSATFPADRKWRSRARRYLGLGLDLLFPPECAYCREPLDSPGQLLLCAACQKTLGDPPPGCPGCGCAVPADHSALECPRCRGRRLYFSGVVRLGTYQGELRTAALRIKRSHERALATALAEMLAETPTLSTLAADVVVPVPMHWTRRLWRGVNGPEILAGRLADRLGVPLAPHVLTRRRRTAPQAQLSPARRKANVRGAFRAARHPDLPGARVLLVDDIMTTGATVNEAAKTLSKAGARSIAVAVLARAEGLG